MKKPEIENLARLMKALGHPVRVQIMDILGRSGECVTGDISSQLPVAASTASQHLSILRKAGLIHGKIDGPRRCYCVHKDTLDSARKLLSTLINCC